MAGAFGLVGSTGGAGSWWLPGLLGGLLKGDVSSLSLPRPSAVRLWSAKVGFGCECIDGFSARLMGGGIEGLVSLRISPDLLGGGGDGGWDAESLGDRRGSSEGV